MKGFIRQRYEGATWTAYWSSKDPGTGERRQHTKGGFLSERKAQLYLNGMLGKVSDGTFRVDKPLTVSELLLEHWLPAQGARGLRPSTLGMYQGAVDWYLIPRLGALKVQALRPRDISDLTAHMMSATSATGRKGLSARTAGVAVGTLKSATKWANKNGLIARDPLIGVERPRLNRAAMKSWNEAEARAFLAHVKGDRLEVAWALLLTRGLRRGELAGLRWDMVNLSEGTMTISRTRITVGGAVHDSTPKTHAGRRSIPLDAQLVTLLRAREKAQKIEQLKAGEAWEGVGHVVADELGRAYHPDYYGDRFEDLVAAAGLPRIRLHDLRHTAFSLMLGAGVSVKVVQELAGHSSPAITLSIYAHTTPSMGREAAAALSASLLG